MKKLLLALAILAPASAWAAPTKVQCVTGSWSSGTTFTTSITATTGNFLVGYVWQFATAAVSVNSWADGANGNYTQIDTDSFVSGTTYAATDFYKANITGGALTVTATFSASPTTGFAGAVLCEFTGVSANPPLDVHNVQTQTTPGTGSNALTSPSVTTTVNGDLVIGIFMSGTSGSPGYTAGSSPNSFSALNTCAANSDCNEYLVQTSAGAIAATATQTNATDSFLSFVAAFKAQPLGAQPGSLMLLGIGR